MNKDYIIYVRGEPVSVSEEVYKAYYQERRRAKTLVEKEIRNGVSTFEDLDLMQSPQASVEERIVVREQRERLAAALETLSEDERELVRLLYFEALPLAEVSRRLGVARKTLEWRRNKVLGKLRGWM